MEDSDAVGINGDESNNAAPDSGAVFLFEVRETEFEENVSENVQKEIPVEGVLFYSAYLKGYQSDHFGETVAVSGDGTIIAVGAPFDDSVASDSGSVDIFEKGFTGLWIQTAHLKPSDVETGDLFGISLSVSADGTTIAIGAIGEDTDELDSGCVFIFEKISMSWVQTAFIKPNVVGSSDEFGSSVALTGDGNVLAVGAVGEDSSAVGINGDDKIDDATDSGCVYIFEKTDGNWTQKFYVKASNSEGGDRFGRDVAVSGDGSVIVVGADGEDSSSRGINGDSTNNGATDSGSVFVFTRSKDSMTQTSYIKASNSETKDGFGHSVAISDDGNTLAVGAPSANSVAGSVFVFSQDAGGTWTQQAFIKASNARVGNMFGYSLAITGNGNTLVVGAQKESSGSVGVNGDSSNIGSLNSGAIFVFDKNSTGQWFQKGFVKSSNTNINDQFGFSVAVNTDGRTVVVGANLEDSSAVGVNGDLSNNNASATGAAYVYNLLNISSVPLRNQEELNLERTTSLSQSNELSGGAIAGIVILCLAPFVVLIMAYLSFLAYKRALVLKRIGGGSYSVFWATLLTIIVILASLAAIGLVGYALYDYVSFSEDLSGQKLIFDSVIERLELISEWDSLECSISDTVVFAGQGACQCGVDDMGIWNCSTVNVVDVNQDCEISHSPFCSCFIVYLGSPLLPVWSCEKKNVELQFSSRSNETDLGLRFVPPRYSDQLSSSIYFDGMPTNVASYDAFYLLFAEPVPNTTPITTVLLISLIMDLIGLVLLIVSVVLLFLKGREVVSKDFGKINCGKHKMRVFTAIDFFFLFAGLVLFGVVLVVAFTNPIFNEPQTTVQRVELRNNIQTMAPRFGQIQSPLTDPLHCKCPFEYETTRGCGVVNGEIVFKEGVVFDLRNSVFGCNVTVLNGDLIVTESTMFSRHVKVMSGNAIIDAAIVMNGSLEVSGNVSGRAWAGNFKDTASITIAGDLRLGGYLHCTDSSSPANLAIVQGQIVLMGGLVYGGDEILLSTRIGKDPVVYSPNALAFPALVTLNIVDGAFPYNSWQDLNVTLAKSDGGVVAPASLELRLTWDYLKRTGVCGTLTPVRPTHISGDSVLEMELPIRCYGSPFRVPTVYPGAVGALSFPSATQRYSVRNAPDLTLRFAVNVTNCNGELEYRRERDWLATMASAGFGEWFWSICPREKMSFNDETHCVTYICDGSFVLPDRVGEERTRDIRNNIEQGIAFDAAATGLDLFGTICEFILMPLAV